MLVKCVCCCFFVKLIITSFIGLSILFFTDLWNILYPIFSRILHTLQLHFLFCGCASTVLVRTVGWWLDTRGIVAKLGMWNNSLPTDVGSIQKTNTFQKKLETFLFTHADDSRGSKAFIRVCLCVCVCVRSITQKQKITKCSNLV